jgi:hypothetical protein
MNSVTNMNTNQLSAEWQALGEGIQAVINQHRNADFGDKTAHADVVSRIEGFQASLRGISAAWSEMASSFPLTEAPATEMGHFLSQSQFYKPLAVALSSYGGRASTQQAIAKVGEILAHKFQDADRDFLNTGGVRWVVNTRFARQVLKEHGLLNLTEAGIWELSEAGMRWAKSNSDDLPAPIPLPDPRQAELF